MDHEKSWRQHLIGLLTHTGAHATFDTAVKEMPFRLQGEKPGAEHSPWEILEHLRIVQSDALDVLGNANHVELEFPAGYWPLSSIPPAERSWEQSVEAFRRDRAAIIQMIEDESVDLFAHHGGGETILREVFMVADHTAYHLGELILLRRQLGVWQ